MTTSSTSTWEASRDDLIAEALENLGAIGTGETRTDDNSVLFDSAARALNRLVKSIDKDGQRLWRFVRRTTTTTSGTASFATAADVLDIDEPVRYTRSGDTAASGFLTPMSRDEYMKMPDRTTAGIPRQYFVEKTLTTTTVYLYPVPDATGDTVEYPVVVRGLDFASGAETPDFPAQWTSCLVYGLTMELASKFNQHQLVSIYKPLYENELGRLINNDTERGNVIFVPWGGNYSGGAG